MIAAQFQRIAIHAIQRQLRPDLSIQRGTTIPSTTCPSIFHGPTKMARRYETSWHIQQTVEDRKRPVEAARAD